MAWLVVARDIQEFREVSTKAHELYLFFFFGKPLTVSHQCNPTYVWASVQTMEGEFLICRWRVTVNSRASCAGIRSEARIGHGHEEVRPLDLHSFKSRPEHSGEHPMCHLPDGNRASRRIFLLIVGSDLGLLRLILALWMAGLLLDFRPGRRRIWLYMRYVDAAHRRASMYNGRGSLAINRPSTDCS